MTSRPAPGPRRGASLALVVVLLLVIDCAVLGTLHLAMLERRLATSAADSLRLRLAAESAASAAAAAWSADIDTLRVDDVPLTVTVETASDGVRLHVTVERAASLLFVVRANAVQPPPLAGRASAALLLVPPVLPPAFDPAAWCASDAGPDDAGALLERVAAAAPRLAGRHAVHVLEAGAVIERTLDGVVIGLGELRIAEGAAPAGMIFVMGELRIDDDARPTGAIVAGGPVTGDDRFACSPELARDALRAAGLHRPEPPPGRARLPGF